MEEPASPPPTARLESVPTEPLPAIPPGSGTAPRAGTKHRRERRKRGPKYLIPPRVARRIRGPFGGPIGPALTGRQYRSVWSHVHRPFNGRVYGALVHPATRRGRLTRTIAVVALIVALLVAGVGGLLLQQGRIGNLRANLARTEGRLNGAKDTIVDLKQRLSRQGSQLASVESQVDDLNSQIANLNARIDRYQKLNQKLQARSSGLQTTNEALRTTVQSCQTALTSLTQAESLQARATTFDLNAIQAIEAGNADQANADVQQGAALVDQANSLLTSAQSSIDTCQTGLTDLSG